jgi:sensor histidine kinase YesM
MPFDKSWIYPVFAVFLAAVALLLIPKAQYKKFFLYGLLLGGAGDVVIMALFSKLIPIFQYKHTGAFGVNGFSIWTPVGWALAFAIFFYLLPRRWAFLVPYLMTFVGLSFLIATILEKYGSLTYLNPGYRLVGIIIFALWYTAAAYLYLRTERIELR